MKLVTRVALLQLGSLALSGESASLAGEQRAVDAYPGTAPAGSCD